MKTKAFAQINEKKEALFKQTALVKAANSIKQASTIYSIKIGRHS